ncbi:MAG TPA: hypothetical protein VNA20_07095 [Frankiaceae bacterium]|nr:hypothetical protein [Frankiaceae bacterium]
MRLPLLAAAVLAAAVNVPSAHAASTPACATALVDPAVGTTAQCGTYLPQYGYRAWRYFVVHGLTGSVDAALICDGTVATSRRVAAGATETLVASRATNTICIGRLTAVSAGSRAAGVNTMVPDLIDER